MASEPNTLLLLVRLALSLGMVLGLVGAVTWVLRRRGLLRPGRPGGAGGRLEVLDRKSLGKHASLVLARVGGRAVLLGVTEQRVEVLSDAPGLDAAWQDDEAALPAPAGTDGATPSGRATVIDVTAEPIGITTGGARRTGLPAAAPAADRTRMNFFEALRELTLRRS